ncbi:Flagellin N-methylase [Botrimarina colliarenosi]|uniref:Flagellin N-methylase n=1 Tax=Botrimarina colliarenosi TaxID=2528001 RepID=A0A5C6ABZ5_9BACT|nr:YkgJ family cysteine cluster protein [Botrimarina colliarenosi]TWT95823.1 Flagellin N-methylase [Botrimarina colliarenosi]
MAKDDASKQPWHHDGLRFTCTECGDCCTGEPGYIWLNKAEIAEMAERCELPVDEFEAEYVVTIGVRKSLRERGNGDCVMLDAESRKCTVYTARPRQCRTWPFWDSNLKSPKAWAETCAVCPGSGKGKLYSIEEIEERRKVIRI